MCITRIVKRHELVRRKVQEKMSDYLKETWKYVKSLKKVL